MLVLFLLPLILLTLLFLYWDRLEYAAETKWNRNKALWFWFVFLFTSTICSIRIDSICYLSVLLQNLDRQKKKKTVFRILPIILEKKKEGLGGSHWKLNAQPRRDTCHFSSQVTLQNCLYGDPESMILQCTKKSEN